MKMSGKVFAIDTNVILRYLIPDNEELFAKAEAIMDRVSQGELTINCDPVILSEAVFVLTKHYGRSRSEVFAALDPILQSDYVLMTDKPRYIRALEIFAATQAHFGDACACAAALESCDGKLFSFDRKLSSVEGINRIEKPSED